MDHDKKDDLYSAFKSAFDSMRFDQGPPDGGRCVAFDQGRMYEGNQSEVVEAIYRDRGWELPKAD